MVKSGIALDAEVKTKWGEVSKRQIKAFRFMINEKRDKIIVEPDSELGKRHKTPFATTCEALEDDKCRYAAVDFSYKDVEGKEIGKVILIMWVSDSAKVKDRMSLASSIGSIKSELGVTEGNVFEMHGSEDKCIDTVLRKICSGKSAPTECEGQQVVYDDNEGAFKYA